MNTPSVPYIQGWVCNLCGVWITPGTNHVCINKNGYTCPACFEWVPNGTAHFCLQSQQLTKLIDKTQQVIERLDSIFVTLDKILIKLYKHDEN